MICWLLDDTAIPQKHEFCVECDKVREEARKQKEDLESQVNTLRDDLKKVIILTIFFS